MNFKQLVEQLKASGAIDTLAASRLIQLGTNNQPMLGSRYLPETLTSQNVIQEVRAALEDVVARDGARYSPAQKARIAKAIPVAIGLGHQDVEFELTAEDYDLLREAFKLGDDLAAQAVGLKLVERAVQALARKNEVQRWQGIARGEYVVKNAQGEMGTVPMELPAGHRTVFGGSFADVEYDAIADFDAQVNLLAAAGHPLREVVAATPMITSFLANASVKAALQGGVPGALVTKATFAAWLEANYGAKLEVYDTHYTDEDGSRKRFLDDDVFVMFGATGDQVTINISEEDELLLEDTIGRVWIGLAAKRAAAGRAVEVFSTEGKAGSLLVDAWQTSAAGLVTPAAVAVMKKKSA